MKPLWSISKPYLHVCVFTHLCSRNDMNHPIYEVYPWKVLLGGRHKEEPFQSV